VAQQGYAVMKRASWRSKVALVAVALVPVSETSTQDFEEGELFGSPFFNLSLSQFDDYRRGVCAK
jgi:hypothetical protein